MIRVTVELIPHGVENHPRRQVLGTATIANVGGTETQGKYLAQFRDRAGRDLWRVVLDQFPRRQLLAWDLLFRALRAAAPGKRNG